MKPTHDYESLEARVSALEKQGMPKPRMPVTSASARAQAALDNKAANTYSRGKTNPAVIETTYLAAIHAERAWFAAELERATHPDTIIARLRARCGLAH